MYTSLCILPLILENYKLMLLSNLALKYAIGHIEKYKI
jgi:hypothetical protein